MPIERRAFTVKANALIDRIITPVSVWPAFGPTDPNPPSQSVSTKALWDTGATKSVIADGLAKELKLTPVGKTEVFHADGSSDRLCYLVNFRLPNKVSIVGALVSEHPESQGFRVIVGMDVIALGDFVITNAGGQTWVSFSTPSSARTDYVDEVNRERFTGVSRNAPCPCGSGKKFKKCCIP